MFITRCVLKGDVSVYEEYRIGPGPPGPAGPAGAPGYFALFIALALGRLHVCVCARVLSFPRTSRGCVRRIHTPERIPHLRVTLRSGAGTTPDSRPLPNTPLQGSLGKNWVRKIPLAPLY